MPRVAIYTEEEKRERYNKYQREYQQRRYANEPEYKQQKILRTFKAMEKKINSFLEKI